MKEAIAEHEGQVISVISQLNLQNEATQLIEYSSQLPHQLDVRCVDVIGAIYGVVQKSKQPNFITSKLHQILTNCQNSFADTLEDLQ